MAAPALLPVAAGRRGSDKSHGPPGDPLPLPPLGVLFNLQRFPW